MPDPAPVVLITGGNGAMAVAIAREFLTKESDSIVYLGVRSNRDLAEEVTQEFNGRVHLVSLDITSGDAWKEAVEQIVADHERIDVLVNHAGGHKDALLAWMEADDWSSVIDSNLNAVYRGCQAVIKPMMAQRYGRIVNIASLSALMAPAGQTNYSAAKAGVLALTQSLAKEVARSGVTVNAVCPGYIDTPGISEMSDEERKGRLSQIPMRRFGKPEEVAAAVHFLASPQASYITGSSLKIDGGIF